MKHCLLPTLSPQSGNISSCRSLSTISGDDLRRLTVSRSLLRPTTLKQALHRMEFLQADPIRAPARAQDLILRHRVKGYRAGDLERRYAELEVEEDFFINYGFVTRNLQALMHPRSDCQFPLGRKQPLPGQSLQRQSWPAPDMKRAQLLLEFIRERGAVHPREVEAHFSHGRITNYWGGSSNATTHLMDEMHYRGILRVVRREAGIRVYAAHNLPPGPNGETATHASIDKLVDSAVRIYAPLPATSLRFLVRKLWWATPQWRGELLGAFERAKQRLAHALVDDVEWYWPSDWKFNRGLHDDAVRLLAPFDPIVWDRDRFELLWGWTYRFEAYTPVAKRIRGYYALPMLWRDQVIGWGNLSVKNKELKAEFGYVKSAPKSRVFKVELQAEIDRLRIFLGLPEGTD